ncbi:replication initiation protein [Ralstonia soli]|uniref:Replication initiation protein n=1 Tax=Ralstonia soli TaxID=2953896 RepID=A0ABT1AE44_9RALS|nr:replication initiation protein [Ralstonia soli]MCO5396656.1 replication initiation protein [Ralstonia soli]
MTEKGQARATAQQLSLSLFEDMFAVGQTIDKAARDVGFQRNNVFIDIVDLGVTARRLVDAAHFIVSQTEGSPQFYDVELSYFKWLMRYDSNNHRHLKGLFTEAQKALIQVSATPAGQEPSDDDSWVSVHLLHTVAFAPGRVRFDVPSQLLPHIKDPAKSHWLSLRITANFTQAYARAIYDHVLPYVEEGATPWIPLDTIRYWPGKLSSASAEFKYFKRDSFEPAIRQINELSDIELEYETAREALTKKINRIRFRIKRKEGAESVVANLLGAQELYLALKNEFGFTTRQFDTVAANRATWTDERILQAIEYTRHRLKQGKVTQNPGGYLMKALKDNWRIPDAELQMMAVLEEKRSKDNINTESQALVAKSHAAREVAMQNQMAEEVRQGREAFERADTKTRKDLVRSFQSSQAGKLTLRRLRMDGRVLMETDILAQADLAWAFGLFAFSKLKERIRAEGQP